MKMAKASQDEIDRMIKLAHFLEATASERPHDIPYFPDNDEWEWFDEENKEHLRRFYDRVKELCPGMMRVTFGFQVLVDNCCDPDADTLEWKPELLKLMEQGKSTDAVEGVPTE